MTAAHGGMPTWALLLLLASGIGTQVDSAAVEIVISGPAYMTIARYPLPPAYT